MPTPLIVPDHPGAPPRLVKPALNASPEEGAAEPGGHPLPQGGLEAAGSNENFRAFFEALDDMIFVGSSGGEILFSNPAASRKLGYTLEELRTMRLIELHPAELRPKAEEILGAMLRGERETCPLPLETKSGDRLLVETRVWPGKWNGKDCLFGLCKDVTEIREAKQVREELLDRLLKIASLVPGVIYQYRLRPDGSSCFPFASDAIRDIYRVTPQEVLEDASKVFANLHPDDCDGVVESIQKSARDLTPWQHEYRVKFGDGTVRQLYGNAVPQREADGSVLWHGFITDITERKQKDNELRQLVERLALATKAGQVGIWDLDVVNNALVWDDNMYSQYGITSDQFAGAYEAWTAGLHPEDRERGDAEIQMALRGEKDFDTDFRVLWPDGSIHHIRAMALVQRNAAGEPLHMIGTNWDITELKRAESTVLQNLARAEELTQLKSRFVSMASHELRTPLANIMLACDLLKNFGNTMPAERSQSVLSGLVGGVTSMVQTLDDLLLAGKLEEGKLPCTPARFPLLDFLRRCCQEIQPELPSRIEIGFRDAGLSVTTDERLLGHVLKNLLENALKYSPADTRVELGVETGPGSLTLSVSDRGIGVPEAEREFLFDAFSRASNVGDKPGSGLGLFITQKCAQAHGGRVRYAPQPDGSVFSVTIPLAAAGLNPGR